MEDQRICIKFCENRFKGVETFRMLQTAYRDTVMSRRRVFEWYKRLKDGREETAVNKRSGRPSTSTTPEKVDKVLELVRKDRRITVREVAEEAGISFGLNLEATTDDPELLKRVITGVETWIYGFDLETTQQASEWRFKNEPRTKKARKAPSKVKVMLTVFFDFQGIVHPEFQQQGSTITADAYLGVLWRLREAIRQELWRRKSWILHHDNAPAHTALKISKFLQDHSTSMFPQPPYSPDLAPCDFFLFGKLKKVKGSEISEHRRDQSGIEEGHESDPENRLPEVFCRLEKKLWGESGEVLPARGQQESEARIDVSTKRVEDSLLGATEKLASCNSLKVNELEARVEFFETRLREPNLVFYGIEREGDENQADCNLKIQNIIRDKMEIGDDLKITKCHRLSRGSIAPVLVVVPDYADRAKIFKNAYKLRDTKISISKDYSKNVREQRRILIAKRKELGERGIKSKLRDNKLLLPLTSERRAKDHIISSLSNKLLDFLEDNSLTIVNGRSRGDKDGDFTYISERGSSTIDYCILSQGSLQILLDFKVDDQLYSDHHPLVLTIKGQNFNEKKTKREDYNITRYRWSADGLAMFKMKLEELREKNIPASDDLVYTFNQRILEAMSSAKITYSIKGGPRKSKPWFDKDCYDMKKLAKESLKKYRKTNRLEDRECYASSRKKYLALLDLKRKGFDNEKQEILRNAKDSKTFWKTIALYKSTSIIQGEISIQDWLNFYRELMTTEKNLRICNLHNVISQNDPILDSEITNADIYKEIAGLRSNKACGPDGIPNEVLKTLPDSYILLLKQLYNSVMTTGKYPAIWTNSTIHPIFKNGYKNSPSNYRGIALISNVSKLFTSILRSRLEEWVEGRRVIPENQAGFRKERSCIDHIFTLTTLIQLSLRKKRGKLYVFFVDLRKAFDTVPHSLLWKKLYNLGISYQFISTIKSYYEQATIAIRWKGSFTESIKINSGVLQGEPLSPLLFILFITDLIEIYNNSDLPSVNLPEFGDIHLLLYADDIAIIGESRINLQKKIKILKEYLDESLMTLNESKSKIMVFRNGGKPSNKDRWFWNDKPIAITSRYTYLGFPLTPTITTTHPANYFKGKALTAINATHPILIKSKAKSINLSIKLFDTIVRAVLMYAAPLWATEHKDLLDNIQDIFIRRFLNLPRYTPGYLIRLETGRISLSVTALKLTLKYWLRVLNMSSDRLPHICFNRTRELSNASGTPIGFIKKLTNLLNDNGSPALVSCDDPETLRSAITGLLKTAADQSIQNDLTRMDKSKLYSHYKDIHISFMTEGYLLGDFPFPVVRLLAQVRILSSFFRENHTKMLCGEDPTCTFCNSKLQNEITHYIFDCSALKEERRTLMLKTGQLCASLPSIIDNMTQNKYIATAFYGFHKSISQKKAK
ncbi:hypothetical protein LAZ67_14001479 [Cordylochernes scorpioides]|uniref:Reverse transcriptase domain-containing protein n=1 Tax=Cordylochernes scorpioides TaxID=51811 RepID=A0ABY6L629_9ARAC|nr:hypothetical protein LAZ67_14001479 [Cordylochernes scorpioides]